MKNVKKLFACLLCLALALPLAALAEEATEAGELVAQLELAEDFVEEVDANASLAEDAPEEETTEEEPAPEDPVPEQPEPEEPSIFGEPIETQTISVSKNVKVSVYLGIPYAVSLKGGIKSSKSSNKSIATVSKAGAVKLKTTGKAKITLTNQKKKKFVLTLIVEPAPAPANLRVTTKNGKTKLYWTPAKFTTAQLVQQSADGKNWEDYKLYSATKRSLDITKFVTGTIWFRVVPVIGDRFGGASAPISLLGPITGLKVICEERTYQGPGNAMNIVWNPCYGATGYEVYHTIVPSEEYTLIGTTENTWFPVTRAATKLDAYRVKPLFGDLDLPISAPVTLWTGYEDNVLLPAGRDSATGIYLVVNKKAQVVTAYVQDAKGKYTIPLRHMICSSGKVYDRTKNGHYTLSARKGEWYRYPSGCYIRWPSIYRSGYYFHSPLYYSNKSIMTGTVKKLGTRQSLGCIRLKVRDAEWIYKNCPKGTAVYICDGAKKDNLKKALKPKLVEVKGF